MASPLSEDNGIPTGQLKPTSTWGTFNNISFLVQQALGKVQTSTLVEIVACTNSGDLEPVGFVDVIPMVNQLDGAGRSVPHETIFNIPYLRVQGGQNAIIIDPEPGDIGLCVFSSRDISKVKKTKSQANPGSFRQYSFSDGMYMGGMLNAVPNQFIRFSQSGIEILSPTKVSVVAPDVKVEAETASVTATTSTTVNSPVVSVTATTSATVTAPIINLGAAAQTLKSFITSAFQAVYNGHKHTETGTLTSVPDQQMTASEITTTVKGG